MTLTSSATVKAKAFKSGSNASAEASASFTVTQPFSFSLANSGDKSVVAGSSVTNSIATTLVSGSSQAVSFSVSGLPAGATGSFSSTSCNPACSTVLNVNTTGSTPAGNFPITITSTGGGVTKNYSFYPQCNTRINRSDTDDYAQRRKLLGLGVGGDANGDVRGHRFTTPPTAQRPHSHHLYIQELWP